MRVRVWVRVRVGASLDASGLDHQLRLDEALEVIVEHGGDQAEAAGLHVDQLQAHGDHLGLRVNPPIG